MVKMMDGEATDVMKNGSREAAKTQRKTGGWIFRFLKPCALAALYPWRIFCTVGMGLRRHDTSVVLENEFVNG